MRDSEQLIERRRMLGEEVMGRNYAFSEKVEAAANVKNMPFTADLAGSGSLDLAKVPYLQLLQEFSLIDGRVVYEDLPDDFVAKAKSAWRQMEKEKSQKISDDFNKAVAGQKNKQDPAVFFKYRKLMAQLQFEQVHFEHELGALAYIFQPDCTPPNLVLFALGYKPQIIEAVPSPLFRDDSIKSVLREHIQRITDLQNQLKDALSSM